MIVIFFFEASAYHVNAWDVFGIISQSEISQYGI